MESLALFLALRSGRLRNGGGGISSLTWLAIGAFIARDSLECSQALSIFGSGVKGGGTEEATDDFFVFLESTCGGGEVMNLEGSGTLRMISRFVPGFSFTSIFEPWMRTLELGLSMYPNSLVASLSFCYWR